MLLCFECRVILLPVASSALSDWVGVWGLGNTWTPVADWKDASGDCYAELKEELQEVKQILDTVVAELSKLKARPAELNPGLNPELKPELDARKLQIVHSSVVALVFVVFVSVLIGVAVASSR